MKSHMLSGAALLAGLLLSGTALADVRIGVAGPLTGPNAATGAQFQKGAEQAVKDINAAGGVNGEKLTIELGDDVSDPKQGVSVANKFVGDGVQFVVGHYNSGVSIPASDVYAENNVFQITPGSTNPAFTERDLWNVFRACGRDDQQGKLAGDFIARNMRGKAVAIIHDKTPYGQGLADETKKAMNAAGITEVMYEGVNVGDKDFSALVTKLKGAKANVVYFGGLYTEAGLLIRQSADAGYKPVLMGGDGITSDEFASIGGPAVEGTLMTFGPDPRKNPAAADTVKRFRDAGFEPEAYTLYSYASVQVIAEGIRRAGSNDPQAVAKKLREGQAVSTVIGQLRFDAKGDREDADYTMYVWKPNADGKISYAELGR
ncbi:branched-chain amino acid ABC transporter substrate-binding protein [Aureimonas leprariae]|uniref:Branched-chain amino acid ABC transporter substrate-binding protein n=1 Tax=Plantimonas leprariae TaxID=2615207 RepID=A0A7V7PLJ3_9HYPH|nr:branched-chain amino acid ABC transporter substrate-binding protein [Aureimonas leprariae]KAB0677346.1 branched-chain amino acid ABC transporter substrate-binding protein [Aureimonas leprariae]